VTGGLAKSRAIFLLGVAACACGGSADHAAPGAADAPKEVAAKTPPPAPARSARVLEHDALNGLASKVTQQERVSAAKDKAELAAAWKKAAPKPKVLFEVPAVRCGYQDAKRKLRSKFAGLCYSDPKLELWGLGPFAVDDEGVLWIDDPVTGRTAAFDRDGKLVASVRSPGEPNRPGNLIVTSTEVWIDSFPAGSDDPSMAYLDRNSRDGRSYRTYQWKDVVGKEYEKYGWVLPANPSRVLRWYADGPTDVVDVSFLDDTRMQLSAPHPLHAHGHRYWVDCEPDREAKDPRPATLVIDDHAVPAPGCLQIHYVGPAGDIVASAGPYYHFDVHGKLLDMAVRGSSDFELLTSGNDTAVGPDGKVYQYLPQEHSVQFVELPRVSLP
jgi:hypothetical protein